MSPFAAFIIWLSLFHSLSVTAPLSQSDLSHEAEHASSHPAWNVEKAKLSCRRLLTAAYTLNEQVALHRQRLASCKYWSLINEQLIELVSVSPYCWSIIYIYHKKWTKNLCYQQGFSGLFNEFSQMLYDTVDILTMKNESRS